MSIMAEIKNQMLSKSDDDLINLLCSPDEELRLERFIDLSSKPESRLLKTELADKSSIQAKLVRRVIAPILVERLGPAQFLDHPRIVKGVDRGGILPRISYIYPQMVRMNRKMEKFVANGGRIPRAKRILAFGLGGSAIGAIFAREVIQNQGYSVPLDVHTSYPEDSHGIDSDTLVVICSYSGNTEETLHALDCAQRRTKKILMISLDGKLETLKKQFLFIRIPRTDIKAPRESLGYWLTAFSFIVSSLRLARNGKGEAYHFDLSTLKDAKEHLDRIDQESRAEVPFAENYAKQYGTFFIYGTRSGERSSLIDWHRPLTPVIFLDGADRAVGKKLANEFGESVEHPVFLLMFCEDAHNEIESVATAVLEEQLHPEKKARSYVFISSRPLERPGISHKETRASQRIEATLRRLLDEHEVEYIRIEGEGDSLLERKLCLLKTLDYARLYTSALLGTNPLPVNFMDMMKKEMDKTVGAADRGLLRLLAEKPGFPMRKKDALSHAEVKSKFPSLRTTILNRLVEQGYLRLVSGKLRLTDDGEKFLTGELPIPTDRPQ